MISAPRRTFSADERNRAGEAEHVLAGASSRSGDRTGPRRGRSCREYALVAHRSGHDYVFQWDFPGDSEATHEKIIKSIC